MATGASIWETTLGDRIESSAALSLCGNYVIVGESLRKSTYKNIRIHHECEVG